MAAPAFKEIAEYALRVLDVRPAPELAARSRDSTRARAAAPRGGGARPGRGGVVGRAAAAGRVTVPALAGLPARSAIRTLETLDLAAELRGTGRVVDQSPPPGRAVDRGTRVRMTLAPPG